METITVMGLTITRQPFTESQRSDNCEYLKRGFCTACTCNKCDNGFLIDEWREAQRQGCYTSGPRECDCVRHARNQKHIRESGLERLVERCSFDNYAVKQQWQATVKSLAQDFLNECKESSFFISGQSGSGKTHICTAICNEIMKRGARLRYFQFVKDGTRLKQLVNDRGLYETEITKLIETPYLYTDDLFKQEMTIADIRLVYEIVNGRYNTGRPMIISSERSLEYIRDARGGEGEAIAGRIFEMCKHGRYCISLSGSAKNQRFVSGM